MSEICYIKENHPFCLQIHNSNCFGKIIFVYFQQIFMLKPEIQQPVV